MRIAGRATVQYSTCRMRLWESNSTGRVPKKKKKIIREKVSCKLCLLGMLILG